MESSNCSFFLSKYLFYDDLIFILFLVDENAMHETIGTSTCGMLYLDIGEAS